MSVLNRIDALWRNIFRKGAVEQELSDELAYALDALAEKKIAEGLSEPEARRQAAIEQGFQPGQCGRCLGRTGPGPNYGFPSL